MFWIGLIIGVILGKMCVSLVSDNRKNNNEEQLRYLSKLKDRNEF